MKAGKELWLLAPFEIGVGRAKKRDPLKKERSIGGEPRSRALPSLSPINPGTGLVVVCAAEWSFDDEGGRIEFPCRSLPHTSTTHGDDLRSLVPITENYGGEGMKEKALALAPPPPFFGETRTEEQSKQDKTFF